MEFLEVTGIRKQQEGSLVLKNIAFTQHKLQKMAIAGETGSGKSTLLKIVAGLVQPDEGEVLFEGVKIKGPAEKLIPGHPAIAYLSQHFELLNNYRIEEVLEYANKLSDEEANTLYEVCRISHLVKRKTHQVSGGEKQRIALARLLITSPKLLILDEPFSNLDMIHKNLLKSVIKDIGEKLNITCMLISHDPLDTLSWADTILVMKEGEIVQTGSPKEIYTQPVNGYVAGLFGNYNVINPAVFEKLFQIPAVNPGEKTIFSRPEDFTITEQNGQEVTGVVEQVTFMGNSYEIEVLLTDTTLKVRTTNATIKEGDVVGVTLMKNKLWFI